MFRRVLFVLLTFTLVFSAAGPYAVVAKENKGEQQTQKLIKETEDTVVYQLVIDGKTYEFHESVKRLNEKKEKVKIKKYEVLDNKKKLVDTKVQFIEEQGEDLKITDGNETEIIQTAPSTKNAENQMVRAASYVTSSGGSYIADVRWKQYSDGDAVAIIPTDSKFTRTKNYQYRDFKAAANNVRSAEYDIATLGITGLLDAVVAAVRNGELISWTAAKRIAGKFAKAVPGVGTIWTIISYSQKVNAAHREFSHI
ncbi:hypothetical protein [Salimicrobium flavidum]|uniref:Uncharacterized protein n=1 Tax=Salimicrobium flavidum TaxID=570947 RepID=A0A1N7IR35_9BACI|nr:hypothetical protein [Salimicrobium flavidum]SIS39544.1 hypothetical protein SAMN05421687_1021 [Salimicrobium flavidum]